jgi:hypothetical protein
MSLLTCARLVILDASCLGGDLKEGSALQRGSRPAGLDDFGTEGSEAWPTEAWAKAASNPLAPTIQIAIQARISGPFCCTDDVFRGRLVSGDA